MRVVKLKYVKKNNQLITMCHDIPEYKSVALSIVLCLFVKKIGVFSG